MKQKCIRCFIEKELSEFHVNRDATLGVHSACKKCKSIYRKAKYLKNRTRELEVNKQWAKNNPDKMYHISRKYEVLNKDKRNIQKKIANKKFNSKYPWKKIAWNALRKTIKKQRTPKWLSNDQKREISIIYQEAARISKESGIKHHVDHIVPLKGKQISGLHVPWNLQILTESENCRKRNKYA